MFLAALIALARSSRRGWRRMTPATRFAISCMRRRCARISTACRRSCIRSCSPIASSSASSPIARARCKLPWFERDDDAPVFLLGADDFGRDVLSRLLYGARTSIGLALVATLGAVLIGALAGAWAGYRGGWVDEAIMRVADFVLVLPVIYVVLVLRAVLPLVLPPSTVFLLVVVDLRRSSAGRSWPRACARSSRSSAIASTCRRRNRSAPVRCAFSPRT